MPFPGIPSILSRIGSDTEQQKSNVIPAKMYLRHTSMRSRIVQPTAAASSSLIFSVETNSGTGMRIIASDSLVTFDNQPFSQHESGQRLSDNHHNKMYECRSSNQKDEGTEQKHACLIRKGMSEKQQNIQMNGNNRYCLRV